MVALKANLNCQIVGAAEKASSESLRIVGLCFLVKIRPMIDKIRLITELLDFAKKKKIQSVFSLQQHEGSSGHNWFFLLS